MKIHNKEILLFLDLYKYVIILHNNIRCIVFHIKRESVFLELLFNRYIISYFRMNNGVCNNEALLFV